MSTTPRRPRTWLRRTASRVSTVLDRWSSTVTPSGRIGQTLFLYVPPFIAVLLLIVSCAAVGVASAPGCDPAVLPHLLLPQVWGEPEKCSAVPVAVDLPSLLLAFTSTLAITIYLVLVQRLSNLVPGMVASGLLTQRFTKRVLGWQLERLEKQLRIRRPYKVILFLACCTVGLTFYWWTWTKGRLLADLAAGSNGTISFEAVRQTWWASYRTHPMLAAAWVAMGSLGIYFAAKQAYLYTRLAQFAWQSRSLWHFQYVPRSSDDDFGWKPVGDVIGIVYVGFLNFTFSVTALLYLLRGTSRAYWNPVIATFAAVGTFTNLMVVVAFLWVMIRNHRAIILRQRAHVSRVLRRLEGPGRRPGKGSSQHVYATSQGVLLAEAPRWSPLKGWLKPVFSLLPGIVALSRLVLELRR